MPNAIETELEACPATKASESLSLGFGNPAVRGGLQFRQPRGGALEKNLFLFRSPALRICQFCPSDYRFSHLRDFRFAGRVRHHGKREVGCCGEVHSLGRFCDLPGSFDVRHPLFLGGGRVDYRIPFGRGNLAFCLVSCKEEITETPADCKSVGVLHFRGFSYSPLTKLLTPCIYFEKPISFGEKAAENGDIS